MASTRAMMDSNASPFYGKVMLAPMVRVCSAGFRALCTRHGADLVFTEEVVAAKLATCQREVVSYPTVDTPMAEYVSYDAFQNAYKRTVVLATPVRSPPSSVETVARTSAERTPRVILQLGVADPARGAAAIAACSDDVDGVDINMGCPKKFSVRNGFGAALMKKPAVGGAIVRAVYDAANNEAAVAARGGRRLLVSIKTRLKETAEETVAMLRAVLTAAQHTPAHFVVHAVTLHARTPDQRSEQPPLYERAAAVVRSCKADPCFAGVCFVLNGSVLSREDGVAKCAHYGFDASMIARAALEDARCFHHSTSSAACARVTRSPQAAEDYAMAIMKELYLYSVRYRTVFNNFKYHLTRAFPIVPALKPLMAVVQSDLRSYADCYDFFDVTAEEKMLVEKCAQHLELLAERPPASRKREASAEAATTAVDAEPANKAPRLEGESC
ncbi:dihydrouridine synthase domain protein-like protein [Leptomonas pyrrhocoris]|uniref:Dihydrouridine synthase domain protein-like protein n=1 Tax=Leptomonas pyrrhocoris TaxID=157538 RepID=A0A0M9G0S1_LEPPY|nr:dihydrouridine synthase domain protein-like protein [Leptomonas pyrrhocoris]KPA79883.1 dihydrouridine synthase domain protein-like protein [Leptomonas pyrrhocoris]|eukprot:XP_015658322.1 dihydrouridine synthase domain protein-like protein [Leptomonas pyrrhocoris]